jgi:uncharacterized protein YjbI with pentapeptide repeats
MPRSIIGWFIVCWSAFLLASVVVGILLLSLYRQSTTEQLRRASAAIAHGCDAVAGRYQFFMAGATRPPSDIRAPQFAQGLTSAVQIARKVDLTGAFLTGASFNDARLEQATIDSAHLERADFLSAKLQGASLNDASLQGADLTFADLHGASLVRADLRGTNLDAAQLQGSDLFAAKLQGAYLYAAQLQGASLGQADLSGASLEQARLQGADFDRATFLATNMGDATLWRTHLWSTKRSDAIFAADLKNTPMSATEFADLQTAIKKDVPVVRREDTLRHISILDPSKTPPNANQLEKEMRDIFGNRVELAIYQKAWGNLLKKHVCSTDKSAKFFLDALLRTDRGGEKRIVEAGQYARRLATDILAPECPISAKLTASGRAELEEAASD